MKKRVFVANHSSMIDVTMLLQRDAYSLVGQAHQGWVRFVQQVMLGSLHCVWFNRGEAKDRNAVFRKLQKHARNENGDLPVSGLRNQGLFFIKDVDYIVCSNLIILFFDILNACCFLVAVVGISRRDLCQYRPYNTI